MAEILDTVAEYFREKGWSYTPLDDASILQLKFRSDDREWLCYAQAREADCQFIFYSISPDNAPAELRSVVAEYLTRANFGLFIGNFELDWDDGEIRYKTSIDVGDEPLTLNLVEQLVMPNLKMMNKYLPGLIAIVDAEGDLSAADAIAWIEE